MSDFGLGSDKPQTVATTQTTPPTTNPNGPVKLGGQPKTPAAIAKKEEKGVWNKMTGWFSSKKEPKVASLKQDNLSATSLSRTNSATNASLRAAQDLTRMETQAPSTSITASQSPNISVPNPNLAPSSPQVLSPQANKTLQSAPQVATNIQSPAAPNVQQPIVNQPNVVAAPKTANDNLFDRIGNWFSSDKKKTVQSVNQTPKSSINGLASSTAQSQATKQVLPDGQSLTPVQTLRLARKSNSNTSASSQGLVPYAPNTRSALKSDTSLQTAGTNTVKSAVPQKITIQSAPKISKPKVAVKQLASPTPRSQPVQVANTPRTSEKTEYVVTPETYRASRNTSSQVTAPTQLAAATPKNSASLRSSGKSDFLGSAPLNQSATKFYFNPGATNLAPHHIAQLKGIAGQAIARERQIVILGTSTPGGEAGSGTSTQALQRLATARAMSAAQNLQKFGVPSHLIKIKIAQSTTPTDIGTGGNSSFQSLSARRVEVTIQ